MEKRMEPQTRTSLLYQQARRHQQTGELGEAVTLYGQVLKARPRHTPTLLYLGQIAWQTGNLDQAVVLLNRALAVDPQYVDAHDVLWQVYKAQADLTAAARVLRRLIEIRRHDGYNYYHLALLQQERGDLAEARQLFEQAVRYKSDDARIFSAFGELLQQLGLIEDAAGKYRQALSLDPRNAAYHSRFGYLLSLMGKSEDSLIHNERAVLLAPGNEAFQRQHWQTLLKAGNFSAGFAQAERYRELSGTNSGCVQYAGIRQWKGEPFAGRLVVYPETGLSDLLQFVRYLPQVKARGGTLILALPKSLMKLFGNLNYIDEIIEAGPAGAKGLNADLKVSLVSLPHLLGATLDSIPSHTPYLFADPFLTHSWVRRLNWKSLRVGLAWSLADETAVNRSEGRSIPAAGIGRLFQLLGISWYSLQFDPVIQTDFSFQTPPLVDCSGGLRDYADLAALIANLDLIIAVDSPQAHLAAALGRPVWTLLPFDSDWRWLQEREDSPWYPTMRLFRQHYPGDWDSVFERVSEALSPKFRPYRQFQPLQGKPREFFADTAVTY